MISRLTAFIKYLGHSAFGIKSFVTAKKGTTQEDYFMAIQIDKAEDYIALRNGKRQLYINLQEFKAVPIGYHSFSDIRNYKNIYLDIDADKPRDKKEYAATEEEKAGAISQIPRLSEWLTSRGMRCGIVLSTGNGAGMVLPIPKTKAEPVFISKLATFLKMVPGADTSTFDPGRIIGIPGTINVKLETEGRKNRIREVMGEIPERIEDQALLDFINSLEPDPTTLKEWTKKYGDQQAQPKPDTATIDADDIIDRLTGILDADQKIKALLGGNIEAYGKDRSRAEYGACGKLIKYGFADSEIDYIMRHVSKIGKWEEEGDHYRFDQTLRKLREAEDMQETRMLSARYDELLERIKAKPSLTGTPDVLTQLAILKAEDPVGFDLFVDKIKKAKIGIKVDTITGLVNQYADRCKAAMPNKEIDPDQKAISAAREILEHGDPLQAHLDHVKGKVCGGEKPARLVTLSSYSAYLSNNDRLYADIVGSAQSGKSTITTTILETFPEENVLITSEASPKSLYYLAQQQPERLQDAIIYIDDARPEHIPVLKTFRNEGNVRPTNLTVADGEFLELVVQYRPVVLASSVTPLRDLEGQATSRAFLVSVPDATPEEEIRVREKIRLQIATSVLLSQKNDTRQKTLQEMARILRDEGVRDVVIPFDVKEPQGADRRGTGQFMRLIKVSAFISQFQRPIIEMQDGRKFVLAIYDDFVTATKVWFDFAEGQEFKLSPRVLDVLKILPAQWPGKTAPTISQEMGKSQRTTERYLEDLYEAGIASREKITAPGMPWGYWVEPTTRQKVLAQISESIDTKTNSVIITTEKMCRKYMAKNSSDSLKDSYINFFSNNDIEIKKMYKGGTVSIAKETVDGLSSWVYSFTPLFSQKSCRDSGNEAEHSETITTSDLSQFATRLSDSDLENVANQGENVAIPTMSKRDMPTPMKNHGGGETMGELICYRAKLRAIAIAEYGMSGWVNPVKIAPEVGLLECQTMRGLEHLGYERFDQPDGGIGYRQKKMAGSPGRAEA